ncbi:unnamed protein product [Periconia digitata]|uniref:Uncharacterized protein n=1 Tax=Periconia digitata TaxID=1303443 RepID=A0A9W4U5K8_9PLEO|nr:unnamed protein product [Periconia digitata]
MLKRHALLDRKESLDRDLKTSLIRNMKFCIRLFVSRSAAHCTICRYPSLSFYKTI